MSIPVLTDEQIATLAPGRFCSPNLGPAADRDVRDHFARVYKVLRDEGMDDYHLSRLATATYYFRPMLRSILEPSEAKHVVEVGCGRGLKALAWSDLFASYVGIEIDPALVAQANASFRRFGFPNARAIAGNAEAILQDPRANGIGPIDLLVLYAVLEHLTIPERRSILRLAQEVYRGGGHVLIAETPNRLSPFDTHSFHLPFVEWLPAELQEEYVSRSGREDLKAQFVAAPPEARRETLYRIGRGLSFHEFECFWEEADYENLSMARDGFSAALLNLEPFRREEADLMRFCEDNKIDIHRAFHRYWLYGLLADRPERATPRRARYLPPREIGSGTIKERRELWALDEVGISSVPWNGLAIGDGSDPTSEVILLIDVGRSRGILTIEKRRRTRIGSRRIEAKRIPIDELVNARLPTWHDHVALPLGKFDGEFRIKIRGEKPWKAGWLTCNGALVV